MFATVSKVEDIGNPLKCVGFRQPRWNRAHTPRPGACSRPPVLTLVARIAKGLNEFNGAAYACGSLFAQFRIVACDPAPSWTNRRSARQRVRAGDADMIRKIL